MTIASITEMLQALDVLGTELEDASPHTLAIYIKQGRELIANLRTFVDTLEASYAAAWERGEVGKQVTYEGLGTVEVKRGNSRTQWDHETLWATVVARALDERQADEESGEFEREGDVIQRVLRDCATPSWKVTGLKRHGIDPDEYCTTKWGDLGVVIL